MLNITCTKGPRAAGFAALSPWTAPGGGGGKGVFVKQSVCTDCKYQEELDAEVLSQSRFPPHIACMC